MPRDYAVAWRPATLASAAGPPVSSRLLRRQEGLESSTAPALFSPSRDALVVIHVEVAVIGRGSRRGTPPPPRRAVADRHQIPSRPRRTCSVPGRRAPARSTSHASACLRASVRMRSASSAYCQQARPARAALKRRAHPGRRGGAGCRQSPSRRDSVWAACASPSTASPAVSRPSSFTRQAACPPLPAVLVIRESTRAASSSAQSPPALSAAAHWPRAPRLPRGGPGTLAMSASPCTAKSFGRGQRAQRLVGRNRLIDLAVGQLRQRNHQVAARIVLVQLRHRAACFDAVSVACVERIQRHVALPQHVAG